MACEPNDLANLARCFSCLSVPQLLQVQTWLLCQILENGGTGGGGGLIGNADPEELVAAEPGTTYFAIDTATFWVKQTGSGTDGWIQLI